MAQNKSNRESVYATDSPLLNIATELIGNSPDGEVRLTPDDFIDGLLRFRRYGKYGYIDIRTGEEIIPWRYNKTKCISDKLIAGQLNNGKWEIIDTTGKELCPCKYDWVGRFSEGIARVELSGKWGAIDTTVREVIPCKYDLIYPFSGGLARVILNGRRGFIDKQGNWYDEEPQTLPESRVRISKSQLKNIVTESVKRALKARISESIEEEDLNSRYDYAGYFYEGLALVKRNDKWGFIDKTGREVIPCKYDGADAFSNGLAAVCLNGKWGFVDKTGREVIPCKFDYVGNFSEGLPTVILNDKWGRIDRNGRMYDYECHNFSEGLAVVCLNGNWGVIDGTGREVIPFKYDWIAPLEGDMANAKLNGKWGFIDKEGNWYDEEPQTLPESRVRISKSQLKNIVTESVKRALKARISESIESEDLKSRYDYVDYFYEGIALVERNDKWGVVDKTGREICPCKYDKIDDFCEGLAAVELNEKYGFIDKTGREVVPCKYDYANDFEDGLAQVCLNRKWGVIDETGREICPCKYDSVGKFEVGFAQVRLNGKWGYIDETGREVVPCKYRWCDDVLDLLYGGDESDSL